jgi:deazaflavin-dependent oxidoreductase (nitroreductase family)
MFGNIMKHPYGFSDPLKNEIDGKSISSRQPTFLRSNRFMPLRPPPPHLFKSLYALGFGSIVGRLILLLTTRGRKTGLARLTALQYEEIDGAIVVGSSRGTKADWYRNILADPHVLVRVKSGEFRGLAEPSTDPDRIADFLEYRLKQHPRMVASILRAEGLPASPSRADLKGYASRLAIVVIRPE